jgi:prepilin peptidase CpaA
MTPAWLFSAGLALWLVAIAIMDLRIRKVRNVMVLAGLGAGLAALFSGVQPFWVTPWNGLAGMLVAVAALLPFYALRWMGAGDVKFAAVIGLWLGLSPHLLLIWVGGSLLAALHGLVAVLWRAARHAPLAAPMAPAAAGTARPTAMPLRPALRRSIPYAGYLALAALWAVWAAGPPFAP